MDYFNVRCNGWDDGIYPPLLQKKPPDCLFKAYFELLLTVPIMVINGIFFKKGIQTAIYEKARNGFAYCTGPLFLCIQSFSMAMLMYAAGTGNSDMAVKYSDKLYFESAGTILTLISFWQVSGSCIEKENSGSHRKAGQVSPTDCNCG